MIVVCNVFFPWSFCSFVKEEVFVLNKELSQHHREGVAQLFHLAWVAWITLRDFIVERGEPYFKSLSSILAIAIL